MIRATTPLVLARIKDVDLTQATNVYVTIKQFGREITLTGDGINVTSTLVDGQATTEITFHLTQSESMGLLEGRAEIQVNWIYTDNGKPLRGATLTKAFQIDKQILARIVP